MAPLILPGSAHPALAAQVAAALQLPCAQRVSERFPDGEWRVALDGEQRGRDVFIVQPLGPPVGDHLLELLLLADACRRSGASRVSALVPYLAYARQDRRQAEGHPLGARVVAEMLSRAVDRAVVVDLHSPAVEGGFSIPVEQVEAQGALAAHVGRAAGDVVVAPDLGAAKRAERFARSLGLPVAIIHKSRLSGSDVEARGIIGEVRGLRPILVDDIISTAGTIEAAAQALLEQGCAQEITVCATHGLFVGPARERLSPLPIVRVVVTDSLPPPSGLPSLVEVVGLGPLLAGLVKRIHAELG
jgi:ribose-phosphate pyrophosphokinase